uniref:Chemokine interleukin-8-like domain-containing protein n=1 Tax=Neogobius melanostomus TaxID=47308 RepID=A0A8C6UU56_9GOBI
MRTSLLCVLGALLLTSAFCTGQSLTEWSGIPFAVVSDLKTLHFNIYQLNSIKRRLSTFSHCVVLFFSFKTKNNGTICVDPNMNWVQNIMKNLDEQSF